MKQTIPLHAESIKGRPIEGYLQLPERPGRRPVVVICHGFKGFLDWGFFPPLSDLLLNRGFAVVRFNFSSSGMRPGDDLVTDPNAFRSSTPTQDLADLLAVLDSLDSSIAADQIDTGKVALLGHSRGAGTALLAAATASWRERICALISWASISTFDRFSTQEKEAWRADGSLSVVNGRTGQRCELGVEVLDDIELNQDSLDLLRAASIRKAPWLIVHGTDDSTVPVEEALRLAAAGARVELQIVPEADHTFGARHPFAGPTPHLIRVFNATQEWLRRHLGPSR